MHRESVTMRLPGFYPPSLVQIKENLIFKFFKSFQRNVLIGLASKYYSEH